MGVQSMLLDGMFHDGTGRTRSDISTNILSKLGPRKILLQHDLFIFDSNHNALPKSALDIRPKEHKDDLGGNTVLLGDESFPLVCLHIGIDRWK